MGTATSIAEVMAKAKVREVAVAAIAAVAAVVAASSLVPPVPGVLRKFSPGDALLGSVICGTVTETATASETNTLTLTSTETPTPTTTHTIDLFSTNGIWVNEVSLLP